MMESVSRAELRTYQWVSALLAFVGFLALMPISIAFHDSVEAAGQGFAGDAWNPLFGTLVTGLSLGFFIGGVLGLAWWVRNGGPGVVRE